MLPAIAFDDESFLGAIEIDDIRRYRLLPIEFTSQQRAPSQSAPESFLGICRIDPESPRRLYGKGGCHRALLPHRLIPTFSPMDSMGEKEFLAFSRPTLAAVRSDCSFSPLRGEKVGMKGYYAKRKGAVARSLPLVADLKDDRSSIRS